MKTREASFRNNSFKFACVETFAQHPSWFTFDDESTVRDAMWDIKENDCVFDVGAGFGSYALTALTCGAKHVFAWTPQVTMDPSNNPEIVPERAYLEQSLALNNWVNKCTIYDDGFYSQNGWLHTQNQELFESDPGPDPWVIRVKRLDDWYNEIFKPIYGSVSFNQYWLKLDVEGAEFEIFKASTQLLKDLQPKILVENHNQLVPGIEQEVRDLLLSMGYKEVVTTPYHAVSHSLYIPA